MKTHFTNDAIDFMFDFVILRSDSSEFKNKNNNLRYLGEAASSLLAFDTLHDFTKYLKLFAWF